MSKWRVYNEHPDGLTHKEVFREQKIEIPAGKFILMDYEDAVLFKGQYYPMKMDAMGAPDRTTFKVIRIAPNTADDKPEVKARHVCNMDGREFPSKAELDAYIEAKYGEQIFKDDVLEEQLKAQAPPAEKKARKPRQPKEASHE